MKVHLGMKYNSQLIVITVLALSMLWALSFQSVAHGGEPDSVCVVKIVADGEILGIITNKPLNFEIGLVIPNAQAVNVPVTCEGLSTLALAVANQGMEMVRFSVQVFTAKGVEFCLKGPFTVEGNGGRGVTFASCVGD